MPRRRKDKIDNNQPAIVAALTEIPGVSVVTGVDDIFVGRNKVNYWFEIKDPDECLKKDGSWREGAVSDGQLKLEREWPGQYHIVTTLDQILAIMGI